MQGVVFMHQIPVQQGGSPPSSNPTNSDMEVSPSPRLHKTKEDKLDQSNHSDSGIFTSNSILSDEKSENNTINSENNDCTNTDKFPCPICEEILTNQHDFTLHIKSHNDEHESTNSYTCKICFKVLSSCSSLDRHILVHTGERPFHCKFCGDTFTTNGNMHRHMRSHSKKKHDESSSSSSNEHSDSSEQNNNEPKKRKLMDNSDEPRKKNHYENVTTLKCQICERADFDSVISLETHFADNHPDHANVKCQICNVSFTNVKQLNSHRMMHDNNTKHSIVGFRDLTFVDFSSEKFPHIARYECEKNLHKIVTGTPQKFQCKKCNRAFPCSNSLDFHENDCLPDSNSGLDLSKTRLSDVEVKRNDFFARLNLQDVSNNNNNTGNKDLADIQTIITMTTSGSLLKQLDETSRKSEKSVMIENDEETQDDFAVEFRKMKLRGEFPCRLCTAVFPNLRALKGHNRAHLNGANNGTYRCNMCPHSSVDKAALIRHMRTHNGDRPYECSLCNYAFTTKANCERHLRNRHAKTTRDEVKKSIIYHPSEDPTNNELNKLKPIESPSSIEKIRCSTPKSEINTPPVVVTPYFPFATIPPAVPPSESIESDLEDDDDEHQAQALDLSKKKTTIDEPVEIPQDLRVKDTLFPPSTAYSMIQPKIDPAALYAQWAILRNTAANWFPPLNPLFFQHERLKNFCNGGGVLPEQHLRAAAFFNNFPERNDDIPSTNYLHKESEKEPFLMQKETNFSHNKESKYHHKDVNSGFETNFKSPSSVEPPNSVKMVIKNGILMPKQKQRRYRTERPFTCEHCSARFTLRSNMERHIKQQHPQFWSQRQRGNIGNTNVGRKPTKYCDISIPNYELRQNDEKPENLNEKLKYALLAQHLRQNIENSHRKLDEEESDLIIDENCEENEEQERKPSIDKLREENQDLVPVSRLLDNASQQQFNEYFKRDSEEHDICAASEEDEEGLVASGSTSDGNVSGTDENRSEPENALPVKKKSAYSLAPNRVSCPYCSRKFPWTSSLRRHILTHTGQKPFKCSHCPLLFTTKSNCDRHLLRKHGNNATTMNNNNTSSNDTSNSNYLMRNVPERPFKCSNCPSSTFSTYSNLKKHISCKHSTNAQGDDIRAQGYEAGSSEDEKGDHTSSTTLHLQTSNASPNPDQPFKCHLCEYSCSERQEALDHIRMKHCAEYELLMSKNALENNPSQSDEQCPNDEIEESQQSEIRGKFPDYSNRKVVCAFCMRRFWSAEDLRRHMRTHTGERPFSCDICRRRFTLKHSMLRHRKKHNLNNFENHSDEEMLKKTDESDCNETANDLISNLLGIRPSFIDKVLTATPDDAAKLLGVKNGVKE